MKPLLTFARYGALPRPNRTSRTIARLIADAREAGRAVPTDAEIGAVLAIAPERVARHRKVLGL